MTAPEGFDDPLLGNPKHFSEFMDGVAFSFERPHYLVSKKRFPSSILIRRATPLRIAPISSDSPFNSGRSRRNCFRVRDASSALNRTKALRLDLDL